MNDSFLINTALFRGTSVEEAREMLRCLGSYEKEYEKGAVDLDGHTAGKHHSHTVHALPGTKNHSTLFVFLFI